MTPIPCFHSQINACTALCWLCIHNGPDEVVSFSILVEGMLIPDPLVVCHALCVSCLEIVILTGSVRLKIVKQPLKKEDKKRETLRQGKKKNPLTLT